MSPGDRKAVALLVALGSTFAFAGLWGLSQAPDGWTAGALVHAAAGLALVVAGIGLIGGSRWVGNGRALAFAHPGEPWKWREDWAEGHVLERAGRGAKAQGVSRLDLDAVPVPMGRTLSGTVRTRLAQVPEGGFELMLTALRPGEDDTGSRVVWQDAARVPGQDGVPVVFRIPLEVPGDARDELEWTLVVRARNYEATFDLPIFRTEESGTPETARNTTRLRALGR